MASEPTHIETAREKRHEKAAMLARIESGDVRLVDVLRRRPDALSSVYAYKVVLACPSVGAGTLQKVFEAARVWPLTPFGQLTKLQRISLIEALPPRIRV